MTTAQQIKSINDYNAALKQAEQLAAYVDQDWDNEKTTFRFDDDSIVEFSGPEINIINHD